MERLLAGVPVEGVCTRPRAQVQSDFSASQDKLSFSIGAADVSQRPAKSREAPCKKADLQVQAVDLSREGRDAWSSRPSSPSRLVSKVEIADILADKTLDNRLTKCVENFLGEYSSDVLDLHPPAATKIVGSRSEEMGGRSLWNQVPSPSRSSEAGSGVMELLDVRVSELGLKLMGTLSDLLDTRVEARLAALESQAAQRASNENEVSRAMGEEICAMGSQIHALSSRISKITTTPPVRMEHLTALEERVIALDRSLSELRCEYLEGCLRARQLEELVLSLHGGLRDVRASQSESKHASAANSTSDGGHTSISPSRRHASDTHAGEAGAASGAAGFETLVKGNQARLETISEAAVDESPEVTPSEQIDPLDVRAQAPEGGRASHPLESSTAEPEPETEDPALLDSQGCSPAMPDWWKTLEITGDNGLDDVALSGTDVLTGNPDRTGGERLSQDIAPELAVETKWF